MADVALQTILADGPVPSLNPVANKTALDALSTSNLLTGATCVTLDTGYQYKWSGSEWQLMEELTWVALPAGTDWTSNAEIALVNGGQFAVMKGSFTNSSGSATLASSIICTLPSAFIPATSTLTDFPAATSVGAFRTPDLIFSNTHNWSGGGETNTITAVQVLATDEATVSIKTPGTTPPIFGAAITTADGSITITLPAPDNNNDVELFYQIWRYSEACPTVLSFDSSNNMTSSRITYPTETISVEGLTYYMG